MWRVLDIPRRIVLVPRHGGDLHHVARALRDAVRTRHRIGIGTDLGPLREVVAPLRIRREGVRVEVVRGVDPGVGVVVVEPCAAEIGVLVDHDVGHPERGQLDGGTDPGETRADDQHPEAGRHGRSGAPVDVAVDEAEFLEHERGVLGCDVFCDAGAHHRDHPLRRRCAGWRAGSGREFVENGRDCLAHLGLDVRWQPTGLVVEQVHVPLGQVGIADPAVVAGEVGETHQQSRHRCHREGRVLVDAGHPGGVVDAHLRSDTARHGASLGIRRPVSPAEDARIIKWARGSQPAQSR